MLNKTYKDKRYSTCDVFTKDIKDKFNKKHSLYLYGKTGVGKTHTLKYICQYYQDRNKSVIFEMFSEVVQKIKDNFNKQPSEIIDYERKMKEYDVLAIDDLGNENPTTYTLDILANIIDYRISHNKPTLISSNYSLIELYHIYQNVWTKQKAAQIVDRIKTLGVYHMQSENVRHKY
jgi:DNA replication protein DnaC